MGLYTPAYRRRGLSVAPTLVSVSRTALAASSAVLTIGGDGLTLTGTGFQVGATVELTGPANYSLGTSGSGTTLNVAAMPAIPKGLYTVKVKNPDTLLSAGTQPLMAVASPATKSLGHYISQGIGLDYNGSNRPEVASAGASGSSVARRQQSDGLNLLPTNGPVIDGVTTVHYGGPTFNTADKSATRVVNPEPLVATVAAWHAVWFGYLYDTQGVSYTTTGGSPGLVTAAGSTGLYCGKVSGVMQAVAQIYDGAYKSSALPAAGNAYHMLESRLASGLLQVRVDQGAWSAGVAAGPGTFTGYPWQLGNYGSNGYWCANQDNVFLLIDTAIADADTADIYAYAKYYLCPSAALP